jgi:hypothetical protein
MILKVAMLDIRPGDSADVERALPKRRTSSRRWRAADGGVQRIVEADTCYAVLRERMRARGLSGGNITMILEVALLNIRPGESADFERAFAEAQAIITSRLG